MPPPKVLEDSLLASSQLLVSLAAFGVSWLIAVSLGSLPPSPHSLLCVSVCPLVRTPATALEVTLLHCDFILTYYICKDSSQIRLHSEVPVHVNFGETLVNPIYSLGDHFVFILRYQPPATCKGILNPKECTAPLIVPGSPRAPRGRDDTMAVSPTCCVASAGISPADLECPP